MAISGHNATLLSLTQRCNELQNRMMQLQSQKSLMLFSQQDQASLKLSEMSEARRYYKDLFDSNNEYYKDLGYVSYTEIPDFEEQVDIITAKYQDKIEELAAWENQIDAELTTSSAEYNEAKAYKESFKQMLTTNIQNDFNYGLNQ